MVARKWRGKNSCFTPEQIDSICEMAGIVPDTGKSPEWETRPIVVSEIRRALDLPEIPYSEFFGPGCWLAGGQVLRWLCSSGEEEFKAEGDFDFYFRSLDDLNQTARDMVDQGFRFNGYRSFSKNFVEYLRYPAMNRVNEDRREEVVTRDGDLVALTPEVCERLRLVFVELISPREDSIQLVTIFGGDPIETIKEFDFSIVQFALDQESLYFGPWTWTDLFENRFRLSPGRGWPDATFYRIFKYIRRGFRPYLKTVIAVAFSAFIWLTVTLLRSPFLRLVKKNYTRHR